VKSTGKKKYRKEEALTGKKKKKQCDEENLKNKIKR